jgi:hypothetical protein
MRRGSDTLYIFRAEGEFTGPWDLLVHYALVFRFMFFYVAAKKQ